MSVPKSRRQESSVEFYTQAFKIRIGLISLFAKDLGLSNKIKDYKCFSNRMNEKDEIEFKRICEEYNIVFQSEYPSWLISYFRANVLNAASNFQKNVLNGYNILVTTLSDAYQKRIYIKQSINDAEVIYNEIQVTRTVLPNKLSELTKILNMINDEIVLLKKWNKTNNDKIKELLNDANEDEKNIVKSEAFEKIIELSNKEINTSTYSI